MKIKEVVEYANKYVHPDVEKVLNKYERKAKGKKLASSPRAVSVQT